jgi:hypothetical protein
MATPSSVSIKGSSWHTKVFPREWMQFSTDCCCAPALENRYLQRNARLKTRMLYLCFPSITLSVLSFASLLPATNTRLSTSHNVPLSLGNSSFPLRDRNPKR